VVVSHTSGSSLVVHPVVPRRARPLRRVTRLAGSILLVALLATVMVVVGAQATAIPVPYQVVPAGSRLHLPGPGLTAYPYRDGVAVLDPSGFVRAECTSFVAWWLTAHGVRISVLTRGPAGVGRFLNASGWDAAARSAGFTVDDTPAVGAVAQWRSGEKTWAWSADTGWAEEEAGVDGHVAIVTKVFSSDWVEWAEYNWEGRPTLHIGQGAAPRYLHIGT
jgi:surface antigen